MIDNGYNMYADTPFYLPSFLNGVIQSNPIDISFIHCHRDQKSWEKSIGDFLKKWSPSALDSKHSKILNDNLCYEYVTQETSLKKHYEMIKEISNVYNIPLLDYEFKDGWKPFCEFISKDVPNVELPFLNKTKYE